MTATLSFFTVTQAAITEVETADTGTSNAPTVKPAQGTVTFTPTVRSIETSSGAVTLGVIVGKFSSDGNGLEARTGATGVELVDNTGLGLATGALKYRVDYQIHGQYLAPFLIAAPGDGSSVDLDDAGVRLPVPS
jgi:hypothetical protein